MQTAVIRSVQALGILDDRTPWRTRLRAILSSRRHRAVEEAKRDTLHRVDDRLLADIGLYRANRIHSLPNRIDQQAGSPVPVALLAMWMPRV